MQSPRVVRLQRREKHFVESRVVGELGVKRCHRTTSVTYQDRHTVMCCQDLHARTDALDVWRPNKYRMKWGASGGFAEVDICFKTVELPTVPISPNSHFNDVKATLIWAPVEHLRGAQDHSRTRAEHAHSGFEPILQRVVEPAGRKQHRHRRAFSTWQDDRIDRIEVCWRANQWGLDAECVQPLLMRGKCALQRQNSNNGLFPIVEVGNVANAVSAQLTNLVRRSERRVRPFQYRSLVRRGHD